MQTSINFEPIFDSQKSQIRLFLIIRQSKMKHFKMLICISLVLSLAMADQLGQVVEGNYNEGTGNTILSAGNYVKGDGNIVAPLDSDLDIFGGDPFFSSGNLFDPVTEVPTAVSTLNTPIYPGPIPTATTSQQTTTTTTTTPAESTSTTPTASTTQTTEVTQTAQAVDATPTAAQAPTSTSVTTTTTTTSTGTASKAAVTSEVAASDQTKVSSTSNQKSEGYLIAGIVGVITTLIIAS